MLAHSNLEYWIHDEHVDGEHQLKELRVDSEPLRSRQGAVEPDFGR
jgi:hypothetical protein